MTPSRSRSHRWGFTLIELLVVIAIIALLVGILLPSLAGAREAARAAVCNAHVRAFSIGLGAYDADNGGDIPGPNTSGFGLSRFGVDAYVAAPDSPSQNWDWMSPLVGTDMNLPVDRLEKFERICMTDLRCPSNTTRYSALFRGEKLPNFDGRGGSNHPYTLSYMTSAYFHHLPAIDPNNPRAWSGLQFLNEDEAIRLPDRWSPRMDRVVFPAKKAYAFEGARYWWANAPGGPGFDYSTEVSSSGLTGSPQGNFTSRGPAFLGSGEAPIRDLRNNWAVTDVFRQISIRHSDRMTTLYFDGHVEMLDADGATDPTLYVPSGSTVWLPARLYENNLRNQRNEALLGRGTELY